MIRVFILQANKTCKSNIPTFQIFAEESETYSKISAGWQSNALHIDSNVLNRIALAFPVFKIERLDKVKSTLSESSFSEIFLFAIITSKFTTMAITYIVNSFSD